MTQTNPAAPGGLQVFFQDNKLNVSWDASSIPTGYQIVILVTDAQDQPLSPAPTISFSGASAVVTGPQIIPGATIKVQIQAVSPATDPQSISLVTLTAPAAPTLSYGSAGLDIYWQSVPQALDYQIELDDANGNAINPQPEITRFGQKDFTHARIAGDALTDKTTYQLKVRAVAGGSRSDWSQPATILIDKSKPFSKLLQALLLRLQAAGTAFDLGPEIVQSNNVTRLFGSLLGAAGDKLSLQAASVSSDPNSVTLSATLNLFHVTGATATFVFTDPNASIQLSLNYPLGNCTVAQLQTAGLLPSNAFDSTNWAQGLAALTNTVLQLDTTQRQVTITSADDSPAWSILGIANVSLGTVRPQLQVIAPMPVDGTENKYIPRLLTQIDLGATQKLPVYLQLPTGYTPWQVGLSSPYYVGNLTDLYALFGGQTLDLPSGFVSLGQLTLNAFTVTHVPNSNAWAWDLVATLGANPNQAGSNPPTWTIITDALVLKNLGFGLHTDVVYAASQYLSSSRGVISASFILGTLTPLDIVLQVPGFDGVWSFFASTNQSLDLSQTQQLLDGDTSAITNALTKLGTTDGFTLQGLEVGFKPDVPELTRFELAVAITNWSIDSLKSWFKVNQVTAHIKVQNPLVASTRVITGELEALLTLGTVQFGIVTSFDQSSIWQLRIGAQSTLLSGLSDLSALVTPETITGQVPPGLPTTGGFEMAVFGFSYDGQNGYFPEIDFALKSQLDWEVLPGLFILSAIDISILIQQASAAADKVVTGQVTGVITLVGVQFTLNASKPDAGANWVFTGWLNDQLTLDFNAILQQLLSTSWTIPSGYGFPTSLTILAAEASLTPATGAFDFNGTALVDWSINFGSTPFALNALGATIHKAGTGDVTPSSATIYGTFTFGTSISGGASIQLGAGNIDTILQVEVGDQTQFNPSTDLAALIGQTNPLSTVPQPVDFPQPGTFKAGITLNLSKNSFLAFGQLALGDDKSMYGQLVLFLEKQVTGQTTTWNFLLAASLKNWSFSQISASLSSIDTILLVTDASVLLANADMSAQSLSSLTSYLPALDVKRGLNFYATLQLTSGLLAQIAQLLGITTQGPFKLQGYISPDGTQSSFQASLGNLTILNILSFNNIVLKYLVQQSTTFTLTGDIALTIDTTPYTFAGDLTVVQTTLQNQQTSTTATAHIISTNAIANPLGIPKLTLSALFFDFYYAFDGNITSDTEYVLGGTVQFSDVVSMSGLIYFKNNSPAVVYIKLDDLDIGVFFQKLFNTTWSLFTFKLKNGMLYYAPNDVSLTIYDHVQKTSTQMSFGKGFHASTDIDILFITDFHIDVTVGDTGIIASGGYNTPIDWKFIQFYRAGDPTKGPMVSINTTTTPSTFTLSGGFGLFGTPIASLLMNVQSQAIAGLISLDQEVPIFGKPSFAFTWDDENGFHVTNWPLSNLKLPDFDFDLSNTKINPECPLTGLIKVPITSKVDITPSFSIKMITPQGQTSASPFLVITINGSLNLVVNSSAYPDAILSAPFVNANIQIPFPATGAFTWSTLADSFVDCIQSAAASIFDLLVKDPQNLAKLLAVEGLVWSANQLKDFLLCEWEGAATEAAIGAFVDAAAGAVATTVVGILAGGAGLLVGGILGSIDSHGDHHNDSGNGNPDKTPAPSTPAAPTLSYANGQLTVSWSPAANAKSYVAIIEQDGKFFVQTNSTKALSTSVNAEDGHTYSVKLVAGGDGGTSGAGPSTSLAVLPHPALTDFYYDANQITATWSTPVQGASGYTGQLVDANHQPLPSASVVRVTDPTATKLSTSLPSGAQAGSISMAVQAISNSTNPVAGNVVYPSASLLLLATPTITGVGFSNLSVNITLQANIPQALSYNVQLLNASTEQPVGGIINVPVAAQPTVTVPIQGWPIGSYKVNIQAVGTARTTIPGGWATSTSVFVVGELTLSSLRYQSGKIIVDWTGDPAVQSYQFELRSDSATVLSGSTSQPNPQTAAPTHLEIPVAPATLLGAAYTGYIQATANGQTGPWSMGVSVVLLDVPQNLVLSYTGTAFHARWSDVPAASGYTVEVTGGSSNQSSSASTPLGPIPPDTMLTIPTNGLTAGLYTGVVKALAGAQGQFAGEWSSPPVAVSLLSAPTITAASYAANFIQLTWSSVPQADSYYISLSDGTKTVASTETHKNGDVPAPTNTSLDITALPKGVTYFAFVSAAIGSGLGASSESKPVVAMDVPTVSSVSAPDTNHITVNWNRVEGATTYGLQILTSTNEPYNLSIPPVNATQDETQTTTLDISSVPDGTYQIQVMAQNGSAQTAWSAGVSFVVQHLTPDILAAQLYAAKVIAPNAAPQIVQAFPSQFSNDASGLITLLQAHFPESTKTLTQLAWALGKSGYAVGVATQTLSAQPNATLPNVLAAIKAAYPSPAVQQQIVQLIAAKTAPADAAQQLHTSHADIDALQMAVMLLINFTTGLETPTLMAQALYQAGYDINAATTALTQTYPLYSLADYIAAIRSVYPPPAPQ